MTGIFDIRVARAGPEILSYRILIEFTQTDSKGKPISPTQCVMSFDEKCATKLAEDLLKAAKQLEEENQNEDRRTQDRGDRGSYRSFFAKLFERWG